MPLTLGSVFAARCGTSERTPTPLLHVGRSLFLRVGHIPTSLLLTTPGDGRLGSNATEGAISLSLSISISLSLYIYIYIERERYIYRDMCVYIYIYMYREREREIYIYIYIYIVCVCIYIYIYIYICEARPAPRRSCSACLASFRLRFVASGTRCVVLQCRIILVRKSHWAKERACPTPQCSRCVAMMRVKVLLGAKILHTRNRHLRNHHGFSVAFPNGFSAVCFNKVVSVSGMFERIVTFPVDFYWNCPMAFQWRFPMEFQLCAFWCVMFCPD